MLFAKSDWPARAVCCGRRHCKKPAIIFCGADPAAHLFAAAMVRMFKAAPEKALHDAPLSCEFARSGVCTARMFDEPTMRLPAQKTQL